MTDAKTILVGVGAVVFRDDDVLLIKRGKPPFEGQWSIPGGKLEYGEKVKDAIIREVMEETGVEISFIGILDVFDAKTSEEPDARPMVIIDYVAEWVSGEAIAGDDAREAEFVPIEKAIERLSWDTTREAIRRAVEIRKDFHARP